MSNYSQLKLYLVSGGEAVESDASAEWDGLNSILVAATSTESALKVADAYDEGRVTDDNLAWNGETISVVAMRDEDGDYI